VERLQDARVGGAARERNRIGHDRHRLEARGRQPGARECLARSELAARGAHRRDRRVRQAEHLGSTRRQDHAVVVRRDHGVQRPGLRERRDVAHGARLVGEIEGEVAVRVERSQRLLAVASDHDRNAERARGIEERARPVAGDGHQQQHAWHPLIPLIRLWPRSAASLPS
jgi:hypothetical protein